MKIEDLAHLVRNRIAALQTERETAVRIGDVAGIARCDTQIAEANDTLATLEEAATE